MIDFTKLSKKEQKRLRKEQLKEEKTKNSGSGFSKNIVTLIIFMNILFTIVVLTLFYITGNEPGVLIDKWFKFTGVEMVALFGIKVAKTGKEAILIWKGIRGNGE